MALLALSKQKTQSELWINALYAVFPGAKFWLDGGEYLKIYSVTNEDLESLPDDYVVNLWISPNKADLPKSRFRGYQTIMIDKKKYHAAYRHLNDSVYAEGIRFAIASL